MRPSLRSHPASAAAVAMLAVLAGACVKQEAPGVAIRPLNADIVFGVTPIDEVQATPANFTPEPVTVDTGGSTAAIRDVRDLPEDLPSQDFAPAPEKKVPDFGFSAPKRATATTDCRTASVDEFPDEAAPLNVPAERRPEVGSYRFKRAGTLTAKDGTSTELMGFEQRSIRNVKALPADPTKRDRIRYTYETAQPEVGSDAKVITTYQVDTAATSNEVNSPVSGDRASGGEPERGLVLKSIRREDATGKALPGAFSPATGLLLVPLPIRQGEAFVSVAVDPATQQAYRYQATVVQRERVDACGEILDGWLVQGTLTVSGTQGGARKLDLIASPQFGMRIINEYIEGAVGDTTFKATFTVGQRVPTPDVTP